MNREIKFRCWSMASQTMQTWEELKEHGDFYRLLQKPNYPMMQLTGLQDKNGSDIYEGDIIDDRFVGVGRVEYVDKVGAFRINYENGRAKWFIDFLDDEYGRIEIIGNIHEDPELLGDKS